MSVFGRLFLLLAVYQCVFCYGEKCGEMKHVAGMESSNVLLQIEEAGDVDISWLYKEKHIATTGAGNYVNIKSQLFLHRLYSGMNGSLNITKLTQADKGIYVANVRKANYTKECNQKYNLTVYSKLSANDIQIHHNTSWSETCSITLTCTVDKTDVILNWSNLLTGDVATTTTIFIESPNATSNWTCKASNPVTSAYRSVSPWTFCRNVNQRNKTIAVISGLVVLLLITCTIWFIWKKGAFRTKINWKREARPTSTCIYSSQTENCYWEIDAKANASPKAFQKIDSNETQTGTMKIKHYPLHGVVMNPTTKPESRTDKLMTIYDTIK